MDERKQEQKRLKVRCNQAKRKYTGLWNWLRIISLLLALVTTAAAVSCAALGGAVGVLISGKPWQVTEPDANAVYFAGTDSVIENIDDLRQQVVAEGAVLLKNNGVLPLAESAQLEKFAEGSGIAHCGDAAVIYLKAEGDSKLVETALQQKSEGKAASVIAVWDTPALPAPEVLEKVDACLWTGGGADAEIMAALLDGTKNPCGALSSAINDSSGKTVYPIGYGLSYTTFSYSDIMLQFDVAADLFTATVTVTNTGNRSGKDTLQLFAQMPAEKLVAFIKTEALEPGGSQTVKLTANRSALAIYNSDGQGSYQIPAGDYPFVLGGSGTAEASLVGVYTQTETDKQSYQLAKSGLPVQNRLGKENAVGTMPITDAENGLQLQALRGLNFDDPLWESFLDQLSKRELVLLDAIASQKAMVYTPAEQIPGGLLSATYNPSLAYRAGKLLAYNTLLGDAYIAQIQVATEDGCLAGQMLKAQVQGICEIGVIALAEEHRIGADTEEKIAREQYLEPYKEAFANGIGGLQIHSGAVSILQEEWGFTGILPHEDSSFAAAIWSAVSGWENPGYISCLRDSCHRLLYNLVNSAAMNGVGEASRLEAPKVSWILWVYVLAALAWVFHIVMAVLYSIGRRNWKTSREYLDYQTMINTAVEA